MRRKCEHWALGLHAGLLLLAATRLSTVSWFWRDWSWSFDYFHYSYENGWGYVYQSDFSLTVMGLYIAAYLAGVIGFALAWKRVTKVLKLPGIVLAALGLLSFLIEGSHWLLNHNLSWICIFPLMSMFLSVIAMIQPAAQEPERALSQA